MVRPLIDWDIAIAFIPALLIGVSVGVSASYLHCDQLV